MPMPYFPGSAQSVLPFYDFLHRPFRSSIYSSHNFHSQRSFHPPALHHTLSLVCQHTTTTMTTQIDYDMVMDVTMSWNRLKSSMPHYEEAIGELIFLK
jgi:hypothetical protein